jgi:hypothetical protein
VPDTPAGGNSLARWRVCVSLALIGLLLYNPFFALKFHSDGLAYSALARHRATVGSSEMQHYPPVRTNYTQPQATVDPTDLSVVKSAFPARVMLDQALPFEPELIASICFRPPPSA